MAGSLQEASFSSGVEWSFTEVLDLSTSFNSSSLSSSGSFRNGDSESEANRILVDKVTLSPSASTEIDLSSYTNFFNQAAAMDRVRYIYLELRSETPCSSVLVGGAGVANPTTAPTLAELGSGSLASATYRVAYSYSDGSNQTKISPVQSIALGASKDIRVSAISLPTGVTQINYYVSLVAGAKALAYHGNGNGSAYDISSLPTTTNDAIPTSNGLLTAVDDHLSYGEDSVRVRNGGIFTISSPLDSSGIGITATEKKIKIKNEDSTYEARVHLVVIGSEDE